MGAERGGAGDEGLKDALGMRDQGELHRERESQGEDLDAVLIARRFHARLFSKTTRNHHNLSFPFTRCSLVWAFSFPFLPLLLQRLTGIPRQLNSPQYITQLSSLPPRTGFS